MRELIDPAVRLNIRIFKALDGMMDSKLATTIPVRELRQFAEAFLATTPNERPVNGGRSASLRGESSACSPDRDAAPDINTDGVKEADHG